MIVYPDNHPKAEKAWYELDITGMDQQSIDVFVGEIRRYFSEVEVKEGKIVYRDSLATLTLDGAADIVETANHLHIQFNLPKKHENTILVSKGLNRSYNDVWDMDPILRSTFAFLLQKNGTHLS